MDANTAMAEDIINNVFDFIKGHTDSYAINFFFPSLCGPTQNMACAELSCLLFSRHIFDAGTQGYYFREN
jgi:hypothetical protein